MGASLDRALTDVTDAGVLTAPSITFEETTINENTNISFTIDDYDSGVNYYPVATKGVINYSGGATGTYTAPDIVDGLDTTDLITTTYVIGPTVSPPGYNVLTVVYVNVVADDAYVDNLTVDDSEYNEGWNIV
jgi:hypothetical protein